MSGVYVHKLLDYGGEGTATIFPGATLTAANFDAQMTALTNLRNAIAGMVEGNLSGYEAKNVAEVSKASATAKTAQREKKWRIEYHEVASGKPHTMTIGCANLERLDENAREQAEIGDGAEVDAFVTAFEAYVRVDGVLLVEVDRIVFVGRNI